MDARVKPAHDGERIALLRSDSGGSRYRLLAAELGRWLTERRDVVADFKKIYGEEPENPEAISIAIDSDDTNSAAESFFGPIAFKRR